MTSKNKNIKILLAMYELSSGESTPLNYEDIVVQAFKMYPNDFQLRGYPEYPDATDVNKPLYGSLKQHGYILSGGKKFQLTGLGIRIAKQYKGLSGTDNIRLSRDFEKEINRIKHSDGFQLYLDGKENKLIDSDFYDYLAVTVSTPKNAFLGRLNMVKSAVDALIGYDADSLTNKIISYHKLMMKKFKTEIPKG